MKIRKGLPPGLVAIDKRLQPLLKKIEQLDSDDLNELEAFIDYLLKGPSQLGEQQARINSNHRIYDFMGGGAEGEPAGEHDSAQ